MHPSIATFAVSALAAATFLTAGCGSSTYDSMTT